MHGLMMDQPLLISDLIRHADRHHASTEIVSKTVDGSVHRYTYRQAHARARRLANALKKLGVRMHDRVATLAWNGFRHYEVYYAAEFSVSNGATELLSRKQVKLTREYGYDETAVLAKEIEEETLRKALAEEIADQIMRRLAAL